jgi:hypothetical protein
MPAPMPALDFNQRPSLTLSDCPSKSCSVRNDHNLRNAVSAAASKRASPESRDSCALPQDKHVHD